MLLKLWEFIQDYGKIDDWSEYPYVTDCSWNLGILSAHLSHTSGSDTIYRSIFIQIPGHLWLIKTMKYTRPE